MRDYQEEKASVENLDSEISVDDKSDDKNCLDQYFHVTPYLLKGTRQFKSKIAQLFSLG